MHVGDYKEMNDGESECKGCLIRDDCECETLSMKIYRYDGIFNWVSLCSTSSSVLSILPLVLL